MPFCVECGADGVTFEGLCADDFRRKHTLVSLPETTYILRCAHCERLKLPQGWIAAKLEDVMADVVATGAKLDSRVTDIAYRCTLRAEDARNVYVTALVRCRVGPWAFEIPLQTRARIRRSACPTCSKQKGHYFVGIVQVRAKGRPLREAEARQARDLALRAVGKPQEDEFVSRIEGVRGGIDIYTSTNALARRVARELGRALGGTVDSSTSLHAQRSGRGLYRSTFVVRVAGLREGDVVEWRSGKYRIVDVGETIRIEDATTGERMTVQARELRTARVIGK